MVVCKIVEHKGVKYAKFETHDFYKFLLQFKPLMKDISNLFELLENRYMEYNKKRKKRIKKKQHYNYLIVADYIMSIILKQFPLKVGL